jgi:hypothetical protein
MKIEKRTAEVEACVRMLSFLPFLQHMSFVLFVNGVERLPARNG